MLYVDTLLERLPQRKTDASFILINQKRTYKLTAQSGPPKILKRSHGGFEKQYRYHCPRCRLPIAYEMTPTRKSGPYTYIFNGALSLEQGTLTTLTQKVSKVNSTPINDHSDNNNNNDDGDTNNDSNNGYENDTSLENNMDKNNKSNFATKE